MPLPIDPRLLARLGVPGPVGPVQMTPGFRPPGPMPGMASPVMPATPMPGGGIPGFLGFGLPKKSAGAQPEANGGMPEDEGLGRAVAGIQGLQPGPDGQFMQPPMPTNIGSGQGGGGSFMNFLRGLF